MMKHTPGPWAAYHHENTDTYTIHVDGRSWESWGVAHVGDCTQDTHNARLISAAPDLLEALQRLLEKASKQLDTSFNHDGLQNLDAIVAARAAIEKATRG